MRTPNRYEKIRRKEAEREFLDNVSRHLVPVVTVQINGKFKVTNLGYTTIKHLIEVNRGENPAKILKKLERKLKNDLRSAQQKAIAIKNSQRMFRLPVEPNETFSEYCKRARQKAREIFEQ